MIHIDTRVGKLSINNYKSKRIGLSFPSWISVSLSPEQAIKVANRLQNPLPDSWVDTRINRELRPTWDVISVKHGNGVHYAWVALRGNELGISNGINWGKAKAGPTTYFWSNHSETLTDKEIKKLCGILYHWAGAMMIGYVTKKTVTKERVLPLET